MIARILILITALAISWSAFAHDEQYTIGIIGTGNMGSAIGRGLAKSGHRVVYGSRSSSSDRVKALVASTGNDATAKSQKEAAQQSDIIILAVPWLAVKEVIDTLGDLEGKIIVDITTAHRQAADGYPELAVDSSSSELIRDWAPGTRVVKTPFTASQVLEDPLKYGEPTVTYIASDDREAKEIVAAIAIQLNLFPLDAGPLRMARAIDQIGFLYLTPLIQGRDSTWVWVARKAGDFSCVSTETWFEPVVDAGNLATFPNLEKTEVVCPKR
jgi:hypothetical protein